MIGADDMVFPRINRLSFQIFFISVIVILASSLFVEGGGFAWRLDCLPTALSKRGGVQPDPPRERRLWLIGVALEFVAFLLGGINFIVDADERPGAGDERRSISRWCVYMIVIASILFMLSVGPARGRRGHAAFRSDARHRILRSERGAAIPILWQHLFWFFGHPEVYVVLLPAIGICRSRSSPMFARKKLFAYKIGDLSHAVATGVP